MDLVSVLLFLAGLVVLPVGAEIMVRGAVAISERLGISPLVIGLTVVAFGTSLPELVVSLRAALSGSAALAVGNVVGSNIANILLILGAAAVLSPIVMKPRQYFPDGAVMAAVSLGLVPVAYSGTVTLPIGVGMVAILLATLLWTYKREKKGEGPGLADEVDDLEGLAGKPWWLIVAATVGGLAGVLVGAEMLVRGAVSIALALGVPEEVVGLTMVAFGTSLPELATAIAAARRGHAELAVGNVVGSNIFNILAILGISALVVPIPVPESMTTFDLWVMVAVALVMLPLFFLGARLGRLWGGLLLGSYAAYVVAVYQRGLGAF